MGKLLCSIKTDCVVPRKVQSLTLVVVAAKLTKNTLSLAARSFNAKMTLLSLNVALIILVGLLCS